MKYLLIALLLITAPAHAKWRYSKAVDQMTDEVRHSLRVSSTAYDYGMSLGCDTAWIGKGGYGRMLSGAVTFRFGKEKASNQQWLGVDDSIITSENDDYQWLIENMKRGLPMKARFDETYGTWENLNTGKASKRDKKELDKFLAACTQQAFLDEVE